MADIGYAEWLQTSERLVTLDDGALAARWGDLAVAVTASSGIANEGDANGEASRQLAFLGGPLVEEQIVIAAVFDIALLRGRVWTFIVARDDGYSGGLDAFVLGGSVEHNEMRTTLDVLRRL